MEPRDFEEMDFKGGVFTLVFQVCSMLIFSEDHAVVSKNGIVYVYYYD